MGFTFGNHALSFYATSHPVCLVVKARSRKRDSRGEPRVGATEGRSMVHARGWDQKPGIRNHLSNHRTNQNQGVRKQIEIKPKSKGLNAH